MCSRSRSTSSQTLDWALGSVGMLAILVLLGCSDHKGSDLDSNRPTSQKQRTVTVRVPDTAPRGDSEDEGAGPGTVIFECVGRVKALPVMQDYTGSAIACDFDPYFVVVVEPVKILKGELPGHLRDGAPFGCAIHSPSKSFPGEYADGPINAVVGKVFVFTMTRSDEGYLQIVIREQRLSSSPR